MHTAHLCPPLLRHSIINQLGATLFCALQLGQRSPGQPWNDKAHCPSSHLGEPCTHTRQEDVEHHPKAPDVCFFAIIVVDDFWGHLGAQTMGRSLTDKQASQQADPTKPSYGATSGKDSPAPKPQALT